VGQVSPHLVLALHLISPKDSYFLEATFRVRLVIIDVPFIDDVSFNNLLYPLRHDCNMYISLAVFEFG
jgi:hypothetical protein